MADDPVIVRRVREFLAAHRPTKGPIVVAVSGGPDSVALFRAFIDAGIGPLVVAHLNHGLRGVEADWDEIFVGDLVTQLQRNTPGLVFRNARRQVAVEAAGGNLEAAARRIRYAWLADVARAAGATCIATGHTADDQAETVLFQLLRGTGLDGLAGIAPRRPLPPGIELLRPMLNVTRAEVLSYLGALEQDYREDGTNADVSRTRSHIRHVLLPYLIQHYNPRMVEALGRLATQAADWKRDQTAVAADLLRSVERPRAGGLLVFDRYRLAAAPRRRRRTLWRLVWRREGWPRQQMGYREWDRLAGFCRGGPVAMDLPGGVRAQRRGPVVQIGPTREEK